MATNTRLPSFSSFSTLGGPSSAPPPAALASPRSPPSPSYPSYMTESYSFSPSPPSLHQPLPNVADLVPLPAMLQRSSAASGSTGPGAVLGGGQGPAAQTFVMPGVLPELEEGFEFRNFVMDEPGTSANGGPSAIAGHHHQHGHHLARAQSVNGSGYSFPAGQPQAHASHPGQLHQAQPQQHHQPQQRPHGRYPAKPPGSPAGSTSSFASSSSSAYTHRSTGGNAGASSSSRIPADGRLAQGRPDVGNGVPWGTYSSASGQAFSVVEDDEYDFMDDDDDDDDDPQAAIQSVVATSHQPPLPIDIENDEPLYVNAKQYERILKRRAQRLRLEELGKVAKARKVHAGAGGRCASHGLTHTATYLPAHSALPARVAT
jgi:hypothetical protein